MKIALFTLLLIASFRVFACWAAPAEQTVGPEQLIARTQRIALAKVISAHSDESVYEVKYKFKTINMLTLKHIDSFEIIGHPLYEG